MELKYGFISADDHVQEHPEVWTKRMSKAKWGERIPHVERQADGTERWVVDGQKIDLPGVALAGAAMPDRAREPQRWSDVPSIARIPEERLTAMDVDGVDCSVLYPTVAGRAGETFGRITEPALELACAQAYNDFVIEEWFGAAPDRYIPMMILPVWDTDACVAEIDRCADQGFRAIAFPDNPAPLGLASFYGTEWDAVLSAAEAADLVLCMHFGSSGVTPAVAADAPNAAPTAVAGATLFGSMTDLVYSPVLHRHPRLKVAYSEGQIGWIPFALQRLDQVWEHYRYYKVEPSLNPDVRPSAGGRFILCADGEFRFSRR